MSRVITVRVQHEDFDLARELADLRVGADEAGAIASFVGTVRRSSSRGEVLEAMTLEHYPAMTQSSLEAIAREARERWPVLAVCIIHRVGTLRPGEQIVLVGVSARHRGDAFLACEFIMDYLKTRAPFWKKERTAQGAYWVDARAADTAAAERWQAS